MEIRPLPAAPQPRQQDSKKWNLFHKTSKNLTDKYYEKENSSLNGRRWNDSDL
jgi:hypothetical protein